MDMFEIGMKVGNNFLPVCALLHFKTAAIYFASRHYQNSKLLLNFFSFPIFL